MIYFTTALYMRTNKNPRGIKNVCFGYLIIHPARTTLKKFQ